MNKIIVSLLTSAVVTSGASQAQRFEPPQLEGAGFFLNQPITDKHLPSALGEELLLQSTNLESRDKSKGISNQLVYLNGAYSIDDEYTHYIQNALKSGKVVILDNTENYVDSEKNNQALNAFGVGFDAPVVIAHYRHGKLKFIPIELAEETEAQDGNLNTALTREEQNALLLSTAKRTLEEISSLEYESKAESMVHQYSGGAPYIPEFSFTVEQKSINRKCYLYSALNGSSFGSDYHDACDGKASISLVYHVDMIRSLSGHTSVGHTDDAKYVRISLDTQNGAGAGIHLADNVSQQHTWFQSWAHRDEWIGPFADSYQFKVYPYNSATNDLTLLKHLPLQVNPETTYRETTGFNVGAGVTAGAEVGSEGPKVSAGATAELGYTSSRMVIFTNNEYEVENNTQNLTADWKWDRQYEERHCDWLTRRDFNNCYFTRALWNSSWVFNKSKFSAISHKNFLPGLSVTYKAPGNKTDHTFFALEAKVKVMALGGKVIPSPLYWVANERARTWNTINTVTNVTINWGHPVFEPEPHVTLQSLNHNDACLDVAGWNTSDGAPVQWWRCHLGNNQLWGFDSQGRYKSRVAQNRCLNVENNKSLTVRSCNSSLNQKWRWDGDKLLSRYTDRSGKTYALHLGNATGTYSGQALVSDKNANNVDWAPFLQKVRH